MSVCVIHSCHFICLYASVTDAHILAHTITHARAHTHTHTQGFEIGSGFGGSRMLGSQHNDEFYMTDDNEVGAEVGPVDVHV